MAYNKRAYRLHWLSIPSIPSISSMPAAMYSLLPIALHLSMLLQVYNTLYPVSPTVGETVHAGVRMARTGFIPAINKRQISTK